MKKYKSIIGEQLYTVDTLQFQFLVRLAGVILAYILMHVSTVPPNYVIILPITLVFLIYSFIVRFSTLEENITLQRVNLLIDVIMVTVFVGIRGGLRSDFYLGYYIILGYVMLLRDIKLLKQVSILMIILYTAVTLYSSLDFSLSRLFIRCCLMSMSMYCLVVYSKLLNQEVSLRERLSDLALIDPLTHVYNRNVLKNVEQIIDRGCITIAMLDIDDFKKINDAHGHVSGDEVLIALGHLLNQNLRSEDLSIRFGGEEFLLIMHSKRIDAIKRVNDIREKFSNIKYDWYDGQVTFSAGLVENEGPLDLETSIAAADNNLYQAKSQGKNKVV